MQVEAPLFLDKTPAGRAEKCVFFGDLPLTSGSGWPGHILFWRSGSASEYQVLLYSWDSFPNCMRSHWLLQGHMMISNNKIASRQKFLSGQRCKIYDVSG